MSPVRDASRGLLMQIKMVKASRNVATASATNAPVHRQPSPGVVAANCTLRTSSGQAAAAAPTPIVAPANCATAYATASRVPILPRAQNASVIAGLMCAPLR